MSDGIVISIRDVSKGYPLYARRSDMVKELFLGGVRHDMFWALRDVSFDIREHQRIGIIGPNGAGKSTLLQIITGNLAPTLGNVLVKGRVSALLALTPSWNAEETGLENIRFNLLLQGCDPARIPALCEDIVEFTELGPFIYQPVKTYSSGMGARLAFAIATSLTPDILIIDEVLASGDAYFVGKAYARMLDFCNRGRALIFVSHSMDAVQRLCDTVIWLQDGRMREMGRAEAVLRNYESDYRQKEDQSLRSGNFAASATDRRRPAPGDLAAPSIARFRIVPPSMDNFTETHFLRRLAVRGVWPEEVMVPLDLADPGAPSGRAALEILTSEWSRLYEKRGVACRAFGHMTGRRPGAQFVVPLSVAKTAVHEVELEAEILSEPGDEPLEIQALDMTRGEWVPLHLEASGAVDGAWTRTVWKGAVRVPDAEQVERIREKIERERLPSVEIRGVSTAAAGTVTSTVRERQPFSISVTVAAQRTVPVADVGIKILRADGAYIFWQSSGLEAGNLVDLSGERTVNFHFDQNPFSAGTYSVTAYVANGWDFPDNYPYSQVFCRAVMAHGFVVKPEYPEVDFGAVNTRARIEVK